MSEIKNISRMGMFAVVVEAGNITRAAEILRMSKGALSKQIAALEDFLGLRLLQRTPRHFCLTGEGEIFHQHCKAVLQQFRDMEIAAELIKNEPAGKVVIDVPPLLAKHFILSRFSKFFQRYPDLNLDLNLQESKVEDLQEGIDIAVIIDDIKDTSANCRRLGSILSIPCASRKYVERCGLPAHPEELSKRNCLVIGYHNMPGAGDWVFYKGKERSRVKVFGNLKINDVQLINELVMQGHGIALQPKFMVQDKLDSGELVHVLSEYTMPAIPFYLIYLERKNLSPKLRVTIDFLVDCFESISD